MYLTITIDVEEDNWGQYHVKNPELTNIEKIPILQSIFDRFGIKPTYLITYPVATDYKSVSILKKILDNDRCEIASHIHPWNTPPFEEEVDDRNTILCNLPKELQYKKIEALHEKIFKNFGVEPISFRSGRWGYDENVAENILKLNYKVDTSILSFTDWSDIYGPNYSMIFPKTFKYCIEKNNSQKLQLLEVPGTVGYMNQNFKLCNDIHNFVDKNKLKIFMMDGLFDHIQFIKKIWLSPETTNLNHMIKLVNNMVTNGYDLVNMFFHSATLIPGYSPFVKNTDEEKVFIQKIERFIEYISENNLKPIKLSESINIYK